MSINICQLFKVRQNVEAGVSLVETPLTYVGTNDHAVVRVRPLPHGRFQVSDGGSADWFASTAGYDFCGTTVEFFLAQQAELLDVHLNDNGEVYSIVETPSELEYSILRVAQVSVTLHSTAICRPPKTSSAFKAELREAILSVMDDCEIKEHFVVPDSHKVTVDYALSRSGCPDVYIFAASEKSRLLEAELLSVHLKSMQRAEKVIAVVESQTKVGRAEYERSSYFLDKSLVFNKEQLPAMLRAMN